MSKCKILLIVSLGIFLSFINCANADIIKTCSLTPTPKEIDIDLILNLDSSISFSQKMGFAYKIQEGCMVTGENVTQVYNIPLELPQNDLDPEIRVYDLIRGIEFTKVYDLSGFQCDGQYRYDFESNYLMICTTPIKQAMYRIDGKILPIMPFSQCKICKQMYNYS